MDLRYFDNELQKSKKSNQIQIINSRNNNNNFDKMLSMRSSGKSDRSRTGSVVSNISNITVDLDVDYNSHICQIAIGIFDEYLRKDSPNKIEIEDEILLQIYEKFGCRQDQS